MYAAAANCNSIGVRNPGYDAAGRRPPHGATKKIADTVGLRTQWCLGAIAYYATGGCIS